jgi:hypothetical protein
MIKGRVEKEMGQLNMCKTEKKTSSETNGIN